MPVKSRVQFKLMKGICEGSIKRKGLSKQVACEFVKGGKPVDLPFRKEKPNKSRKFKVLHR